MPTADKLNTVCQLSTVGILYSICRHIWRKDYPNLLWRHDYPGTVFSEQPPCCMDRRCGRIEPYPCSGSCGADILGASQLQHSVQHVGGDRHLGCLSPVGLEA